MYATIRRYTSRSGGTFETSTFTDLKRRLEDGLIPVLHDIRGFHGYYMVNVGNREIVSINLFEDKAGATESTKRAAEFVKKDPLKDQLGNPEIIEGELVVAKEAAVATR